MSLWEIVRIILLFLAPTCAGVACFFNYKGNSNEALKFTASAAIIGLASAVVHTHITREQGRQKKKTKSQIANLESTVQPRKISIKDAMDILNILCESGNKGNTVNILYHAAQNDVPNLTAQIKDLFERTGYNVETGTCISNGLPQNGIVFISGMSLDEKMRQAIMMIQDAAGQQRRGIERAHSESVFLTVIIGAKP